jgi:uncharacterized SAM-binding protein YcdF (DUF218 family)
VSPVIIIFGAAVRPDGTPSGAMRHRVASAIATGTGLGDPIYLPTGGQGRYGRPEAAVMADLLAASGVSRSHILLEPTGRNTLRSALACRHLLGRTRAPVYVATSGYHMLRSVLLLRLAGLRARPSPLPLPSASRSPVKRWFWRLRELPAIPTDAAILLLMRLRRPLD